MSDDWPFENTETRMAIAAVAPKTEPELLAAIDHQDHATRIVYADWLEEQGDLERAEFVRLQDRILALPDGPEREEAIRRATTLANSLDAACSSRGRRRVDGRRWLRRRKEVTDRSRLDAPHHQRSAARMRPREIHARRAAVPCRPSSTCR